MSMLTFTCLKVNHLYKLWLDSLPRTNLPPQPKVDKVKLTASQSKQIEEQTGTKIKEFNPEKLKPLFNVRRWFTRFVNKQEQPAPDNHDRATETMEFVERWGSALMFAAYFVAKLILNVREWTK